MSAIINTDVTLSHNCFVNDEESLTNINVNFKANTQQQTTLEATSCFETWQHTSRKTTEWSTPYNQQHDYRS